ncbi:33845_t:CDS:2 [Racocetra persica]|uniref:33845_t:CDS:1 n=1 Tax=Racocetra persica TaxID=160502 RepID=A0ACA9PP54_9GLOM|nr:33845_t:CDS:2 [Racocetra persica]
MLRNKSQGLNMHVSDFICQSIGRLKLSGYERYINGLLPDDSDLKLKHTEACVIIYPGSNRDGWWTCNDLINQLTERAIPIFERTHPNKIALFMFDNSSNHGAFADDALLVSRINMGDGTKMPLLRDGTKPDGSTHVMTYIDDKGLIKRCNACKKNKPDPKNPKCCATRILSAQSDFASQRSRIQEVIEAAGHMCIFYPKFHCELNYIESFWAEAKRVARLSCDYSFRGLKRTVPRALDSVGLIKIRRFARRSERFMSAYKLGLSRKAAAFAVKKYRSHRRIPEKVLEEFARD